MQGKVRQRSQCFPLVWAVEPDLFEWAEQQRSNGRNDLLGEKKRHRLDALGFEWNPQASEKESPHNKQPSTSVVRFRTEEIILILNEVRVKQRV